VERQFDTYARLPERGASIGRIAGKRFRKYRLHSEKRERVYCWCFEAFARESDEREDFAVYRKSLPVCFSSEGKAVGQGILLGKVSTKYMLSFRNKRGNGCVVLCRSLRKLFSQRWPSKLFQKYFGKG